MSIQDGGHPELTVSSLWHQLGCSSDGLGEDPYQAFPHARDHSFGSAASWTLQLPVPLEVLHGLIHNAGNGSWKRGKEGTVKVVATDDLHKQMHLDAELWEGNINSAQLV